MDIKMKKLNEVMDTKKLDAVVIVDPFNMRYLSGFRGGEGILFISKEKRVLITDSRYTEAAEKESSGNGFQVIEENAGQTRFMSLSELVVSEDIHSLGFEDASMLCADFERLKKEVKVAAWAGLGESINAIRQVKTEEELVKLRRAEAIGDAAFSDILSIIKTGMTEKQVAAELEYAMKKHGADGYSFDSIIASGIHSSMPHAIPDDKKIENGDFVTMDFGCLVDGYCSDMTRTIVVGKANDKQKEIYHIVLEAQEAALHALKAGVRGRDVDKVARDIITDAGYGNCFGHGLGHSVGLFIHESPRLSPKDETILLENMIETVEPGIYVPGFGGVRIEDMVVVKKDGIENLAHSPKHLIEL